MEINQITEITIAAAIEVHRALGPGLLESAYRRCLLHELKLRGIEVRNELDLPIMYKGLSLDCGYHVDLLVLGEVAVEVKAIDKRHPIHEAHLLTYLRVGGWKVGWLINFKVPVLKDGIKRRVLNF